MRRVVRRGGRRDELDELREVCAEAVERDVLPRGRERGVVRAEPDREEAYFREVLLLVLLRKRLLVRWSQGAMKGCVDCTPVRIQR